MSICGVWETQSFVGEKTLYFGWVLVSCLLFVALTCAYGFCISMTSALALAAVFRAVLYVAGLLRTFTWMMRKHFPRPRVSYRRLRLIVFVSF